MLNITLDEITEIIKEANDFCWSQEGGCKSCPAAKECGNDLRGPDGFAILVTRRIEAKHLANNKEKHGE